MTKLNKKIKNIYLIIRSEGSPSKPISKVKLPDEIMNINCGTKLETIKSMEQSRYPPNLLKTVRPLVKKDIKDLDTTYFRITFV